jgi:putative polyhydroxyalkanoate system protein
MSEIHLRRKHSIGLKKAKVAAQKVADDLAEEYGMQAHWEGDLLRFSRSGVDGALKVSKNEVVLDAKLGFLLSAFRARIEEHINENFDRYFV